MASVEEARKAQERLRALQAQKALREGSPAESMATTAIQGVNVGIEQGVGSPVDLMTAGINKILTTKIPTSIPMFEGGKTNQPTTIGEMTGIKPITDPVGGSKQLQEIGARLGFNYGDISEVPENLRPIARGGEAVGAAIPFAAAPFAKAASLGAKPASGPFRSFVEPARTMPYTTAAIEATSALGAGVGAGVAETLFPNDPLARMGGELAGGFLSPLSIFAKTTRRLTGGMMDMTRRVRESFSPAAAEKGAARHAQDLARTFGEDPQKIAKALRTPLEVEGPLSSGARSQSLALQALERKLVKNSHLFGIDVQRDLKTSIDKINFAFNEVAGTGNPEALRNLAIARKEYARSLIDANFNLAERRIIEARESIVPSSATNAATQRRARELLLESLADARKVEDSLWKEIPKDVSIDPTNLRDIYNTEVTAGLLPGETLDLPGPVINEIKQVTGNVRLPTSERLLRLRSRILNEIRKEAGSQAPDRDRIRRMGLLQDSILDDLGKLAGAAEARAFSRDLNDRFTRGYAGKVLSLDPRGGERVAPELTLEGLRGKGGAVASEQLERAVPVQEMRELEEQMLRDMAASSIDPLTGQVNPRSLERFRQANKEILSRFPELDNVFSDAASTTAIYGNRLKRLSRLDKHLQANSAFAKVLGSEDPMRVMKSALNGPNPIADMDQIFLMARKDPQALEGARRTYLDLLFNESAVKTSLPGGESSLISGSRLRELLEVGDGGVLSAAKKAGVINDGHVKRLNAIAEEAIKIENALKFPGELDKIVKDPSMLTDLVARLVGANIGSHSLIAKGSGAQLVMAHAGSRAVRRLVEKIPAQNITRVLQSAVRDPELMARLLTRDVGESRMQKIASTIERKLRDEGIMYQISETWRPPLAPIGAGITELPEIMEK